MGGGQGEAERARPADQAEVSGEKYFSPMQVSIFTVAPGDAPALEELNRFLRGHRVLTLDRECHGGVWSFCVAWQPPAGAQPNGVRF